jgi:hypothetical protein
MTIRKMIINYDDSTIKTFLESWSLNREQNENILARIESGELVKIGIGCDTGHRWMTDCNSTRHKEGKYDIGGTWTRHCAVCNEALQTLKTERYYDGHSIQFAVSASEAEARLIEEQQKIDNRRIEKQREHKEFIDSIIAKAKATGQRQILRQYSDECDGSDGAEGECDVDNIIEYMTAEGEIEIERIHTY